MRLADRLLVVALFFAASTTGVCPAHATQVLPVNISEMMEADLVFSGKCIGAKPRLMSLPGKQGEFLVTTYTFSVPRDGVLKGSVPENFEFTQLGATREDARRLGAMYVIGMPTYEVGREYMLFLGNETALGLRTTLGLGQGRFSVIEGKDGKRQVVNDSGNKGLFANVPVTKAIPKALSAGRAPPAAEAPQGPIDYDSFVQMVRELKGQEKGE